MQGPESHLSVNASHHSLAGLKLVSLLMAAMCVNPLYAAVPKPRLRRHENLHRQIDHLEHVWREAILSSDTAVMSSLLANDYTAITPNGTLQTKQDALTNLSSGRVHFTELSVSDRKVRFYGNTAVVTSRAQVQGTNNGTSISGDFRYTRVYVRNAEGKWKIVSFEASRIHHDTRASR